MFFENLFVLLRNYFSSGQNFKTGTRSDIVDI